MNTTIKYLQLPFTFSEERLVHELNTLDHEWTMHFNTAHYDGEWSALALRSSDGKVTSLIPSIAMGAYTDTVLMDQCPYIKSILSHFPCELLAVRLLKLKAGAVIKEHRDNHLNFEYGEARVHVPILTNPQLEFYLDNERIEMLPGSCWYMNFNLPHRIHNNGDTDRVHLVMDIAVNDNIRKMFADVPEDKIKRIPKEEQFSPEQKREIIKQLRGMGTEMGEQLANEMEAGMAV